MSKQDDDKRIRFIPFRKHDIVEMCLQENQLPGQEEDFRTFYKMLDSIYHFEFHQIIESMKDAYASVDPDSVTHLYKYADRSANVNFVEMLRGLLEKANYERVTEDELNKAMKESSLFKISLQVNLDDFAEVLLFYRGVSTEHKTIPIFWGLLSKSVTFTNYSRVVVYIRFRDDYGKSKGHQSSCRPGSTLLKLFQNVPKADIEMLFPNTRVSMRIIDKLLIGVPAVVSGGIVLTTKLGTSLVLLGSLLGFWLGLSSQPVELNKATLAALLAGGQKGKRYALPRSRILIHQPLGGASGQASDLEIQAREILKMKHLLIELLATHSGQPIERIMRDSDRDYFMSAEEAKKYGIIDTIIS